MYSPSSQLQLTFDLARLRREVETYLYVMHVAPRLFSKPGKVDPDVHVHSHVKE